MKNLVLISLFLLSTEILVGNPEKDLTSNLIIHGTLNNIHQTITCVYIFILKANNNSIDSVKVVNNKYAYKTKLVGATLVTLYAGNPNNPAVMNDKNAAALFLEGRDVDVVSTDSFSNVSVSGSVAFIQYENFKKSAGLETKKGFCSAPPDDSVYDKLFKKDPSSLLAPYILWKHALGYANENMIKLISPLYEELTPEGKSSYFGSKVKLLIDKAKPDKT